MIATCYQHLVIKWCVGWLILPVVHYHQSKVEINITVGCSWDSFLPNQLIARWLRLSSLSLKGPYIFFEILSYQFQIQMTWCQNISSYYAPILPSIIPLHIIWLIFISQSVSVNLFDLHCLLWGEFLLFLLCFGAKSNQL